MGYSRSGIDNSNFLWFEKDNTRASLVGIKLIGGNLRGLKDISMHFEYPITAIAGVNGSGKTTVLAMAACAFHNTKDGFKLPGEKISYYTFSDFFIQSSEEVSPDGLAIIYDIRYNNWHNAEPGVRSQARIKKKDGRWNNYDRRVSRNVVYFGIQRVVPNYESSAHKSYRQYFAPIDLDQRIRTRIKDIAGRVIGKNYDDFYMMAFSKYTLPVVVVNGVRYSGFNMGAGESTVFGVLSVLFDAGPSTLIVIDEVELGLHEKAQRRFIEEMKVLCNELKCQVICSTHSSVILDSLPPEARFYLEGNDENTTIIKGISSEYACGKMSGENQEELCIFVEDEVAKTFLCEILPLRLRERLEIVQIGSDQAVLRQFAARYRENAWNFIAFLDGDKRKHHSRQQQKIKEYLETRYDRHTEKEIEAWIDRRLFYIPGDTWPEKWLIDQAVTQGDLSELEDHWGVDDGRVRMFLEEALRSGKHNEFFTLSRSLQQNIEKIRFDIMRFVKRRLHEETRAVIEIVQNSL